MPNEERHYTGQKLNIIFTISSVLLLVSLLLMFKQDHEREWKKHQRDFRTLEVEKTHEKFYAEIEDVESTDEYKSLTKQIETAREELAGKKEALKPIQEDLTKKIAQYELIDQKYKFAKAEYDSEKYLYETALAHHDKHAESMGVKFEKLGKELKDYKLKREDAEVERDAAQAKLDEHAMQVTKLERELRRLTGNRDLLERKLGKIDTSRMSFLNKIGDTVRNQPVVDMLNPSLKIEQTVLNDITDDVNFMRVPKVDRCITCHQGILNPDYKDAPQPFTTHPNLELFLASDSAHPVEEFGCTSCHDGRGRGTSFVASAHTPNSEEQAKEWKEKYDWHPIHLWEKPMYPKKYVEAGCLKCHMDQTTIQGAEKLNLGLNLIEKAGCYGCHTIKRYEGWPEAGPNLEHMNEKLDKDWVYRWIHDPKSFRHNTWMPSFFGQTNSSDPESVKRTDQEIHAIVHYLFNQPEEDELEEEHEEHFELAPMPLAGNAENGQKLVASLGCYGCHEMEKEMNETPTTRQTLREQHGPNLIGLGSKTSKDWLYSWLKNPAAYNHDTQMPNLRLSDQEAADIAAFLSQDKNANFDDKPVPSPDEEEINKIVVSFLMKMMPEKQAAEKASNMPLDEKLFFAGEKLIRHYGCFSCHHIHGFETEKPIGTELTEEASKPVKKLDFGSVHEIGHTNYDWFTAKLKNPRIFDRDKVKEHYDKLKMPNFHFTDAEIEAITTALLGFVKDRPAPNKIAGSAPEDKFIEEGRKIIRQFNCQGCHIMEGEGGDVQGSVKDWFMKEEGKSDAEAETLKTSFSPPNLIGQGAKVQTDWLFNFFHNVESIRPWLKMRMPTFNWHEGQVNSLVKYFNYLDNQEFPFEKVHEPHLTPEEIEAGKKLFSTDYFGCVQCHIVGDKMPDGSPENWAPDFALAHKRLKPDWVIAWMKDPQGLLPGTKMPTFFDAAYYEFAGPDDILEGDEDRQIEAMRDYMWYLGGKSKTSNATSQKNRDVTVSPA